MPKTPIRNPYMKQLAAVNDQLCYYLFADKEVQRRLEGVPRSKAQLPTTDVFPDNEFSPRIRVNLGELESFRAGNRNSNCGLSFAMGTEYLMDYMADVQGLRRAISPSGYDQISADAEEEQLLKKLEKWGSSEVDVEIFVTARYLRLRRNHFIHNRSELSPGLTKFIRYESKPIDKFWRERTDLDGLDFSKHDVRTFAVQETLTLMKLLRVCLEEVDAAVASTLDYGDIVKFEARSLFTRDRSSKAVTKKTIRQVGRIISIHYSLEPDRELLKSKMKELLESS